MLQLDVWLDRSLLLHPEEFLHIKRLLSHEYVIDRSAQPVCENAERLCLAVFSLEPLLVLHPCRVILEKKYGSFRERPFQVHVADLATGAPIPLSRRLPGAGYQPGVRGEVLNPRKAIDIADLIEDHQGDDLPHSMDTLQEVQRLGIVIPGDPQYVSLQIGQQPAEMIDQLEIRLNASLDVGITELLGKTLLVHLTGYLLPELGQVVLRIGVLDVSEQIGAPPHEIVSAPQQVPGGSHLGWIDISHWNHAAA